MKPQSWGTFGQLRHDCGLLQSTASERETKASPLASKRLHAGVCIFEEVVLCEGLALMIVSRHGGSSVAESPTLGTIARVCRLYVLSGCIFSACCSLIAKNFREVICWYMHSFPA